MEAKESGSPSGNAKEKLYSLYITFIGDPGGQHEEANNGLSFEQAKEYLESLRKRGYDLIPMFTFGGPIERGDVFLYARRTIPIEIK